MYIRKNLLLTLCIIITAFFFIGAAQKAVKMEYKQKAGVVKNYNITNDISIEIEQAGQLIGVSVNSKSEVSHKIGRISDGKITHELSFMSLSVETESDYQGTSTIDTKDILNKPLTVITGKKGENPEPVDYQKLPALGDNPIPAALGLMRIIPELSGTPVKPGDKWTITVKDSKIELPAAKRTVNVVTDYTFTVFEDRMGYKCMKITGTAKTKTDMSGTLQGMEASVKTTESSKITAYFAYNEGFFVEMSSTGKSETTLDIPSVNMSQLRKGTSKATIVLIKK